MHHDIHAHFERPLEIGREERVVADGEDAGFPADRATASRSTRFMHGLVGDSIQMARVSGRIGRPHGRQVAQVHIVQRQPRSP